MPAKKKKGKKAKKREDRNTNVRCSSDDDKPAKRKMERDHWITTLYKFVKKRRIFVDWVFAALDENVLGQGKKIFI